LNVDQHKSDAGVRILPGWFEEEIQTILVFHDEIHYMQAMLVRKLKEK